MLTLTPHLSEDRLTAYVVGAALTTREAAHLRRCVDCAEQHARLATLVRDVSAVATREADSVFPPARLAEQRARIMSRVGRIAQPTPVLDFPAPAAVPRAGGSRRWLGAAASAAAGLLLGAVAGQALLDPEPAPPRAAVETPVEAQAAPVVRPAAITISDDELLLQIETAGQRPHPATLRSLDALTPRAADLVSLR